jgi:hypothetical protein
MAFTLTSPITGGAQTGFTSPTYTHVVDVAPDVNGKQVAVTALGGTQTGVTAHSVSSPFTITYVKPKNNKVLGKPNPVTGLLPSVPVNTHKIIVRKGVLPLAGQPYSTLRLVLTMDIPAGSDTADPANIRGALSALFGSVAQQSAGVGDTLISGVM